MLVSVGQAKIVVHPALVAIVACASTYGETVRCGPTPDKRRTVAPAYTAPAHTAPAYTAPAYTAPAHTAPAHTAPAYTAPAYTAPAHTARRCPLTRDRGFQRLLPETLAR